MNKIVTLNALRGNSYSLFRKIPLMINMGAVSYTHLTLPTNREV